MDDHDVYGTLTITLHVEVSTCVRSRVVSFESPVLTVQATRIRRVTLAKAYIPRSMVEDYVRYFRGSNSDVCKTGMIRATFEPERERITI